MSKNAIKIVDLFAGPGGLGEGFSSLESFRIAVSAEMESSAHATLRLRAFYRILQRRGATAIAPYFDLCNGKLPVPRDSTPLPEWDARTAEAWIEACGEALQLTLGEPQSNTLLDKAIAAHKIDATIPWVLIGGPPCQAYSLVGRSRNKGKADYKAENDHRHFLYREYLRIILEYKPHVFVMENVKGILSSKVGGQRIFHNILKDLAGCGYRIHSLVTPACFTRHDDPHEIDAREFVVKAERYGIPQARHRVILLGIREDVHAKKEIGWKPQTLIELKQSVTVRQAIGDLPRVRSSISKGDDADKWKEIFYGNAKELALLAKSRKFGMEDVGRELDLVRSISNLPSDTGTWPRKYKAPKYCPDELRNWYSKGALSNLHFVLNHEARGHMESDLRRYLFASAFAKARGYAPKGHEDFCLPGLAPEHDNWQSGYFSDRFRVQIAESPSTTVVSHIAKDGHYFIHYDSSQCRSLTVREAARLQTFPDDYYFQGNRTQQFQQVGNAVPPYLASKIAKIVKEILS
ncbi:DNA cytosine methyltransferase [Pseudoduganella sp.]|uniref:DNA cytosine methyltransferase n=1 Tax=Pseudoduganella sp. TaxID=1880898 RepID=UPI0035B441E6